MSAIDHFTGERFLPSVSGEIAYEHCHRYAFARRFVAGARVLDAACGEGYGSALLAKVAASVVAIDIEPQVVIAATARYGAEHRNLRFDTASVTHLPLGDAVERAQPLLLRETAALRADFRPPRTHTVLPRRMRALLEDALVLRRRRQRDAETSHDFRPWAAVAHRRVEFNPHARPAHRVG